MSQVLKIKGFAPSLKLSTKLKNLVESVKWKQIKDKLKFRLSTHYKVNGDYLNIDRWFTTFLRRPQIVPEHFPSAKEVDTLGFFVQKFLLFITLPPRVKFCRSQ